MSPEAVAAWRALPPGTHRGHYRGAAWTASVKRSADGKRGWLLGEALAGPERVSANVWRTAAGWRLKPCEMEADAVEAFLSGFRASPSNA